VQDPDEGWVRWMRSEVKQADRVLLVFTETYQRRFEGDEEEGIVNSFVGKAGDQRKVLQFVLFFVSKVLWTKVLKTRLKVRLTKPLVR
jgi:hypothetical protein